jgi:hypothetical protein
MQRRRLIRHSWSSGKWKRHPTCPKRQVKIILWYVQFLKSKMINIKLFSVGSHGEFYLNNWILTNFEVCLPITFITTSILTNFEVCLPITFITTSILTNFEVVMGKHTSKLVRIDVVMNVMGKHTSKLVRIDVVMNYVIYYESFL